MTVNPQPVPPPTGTAAPPARQWWKDAVVYQVYPRSFADSDGNGVGDLAGVTSRVPYLAALGVDAVWVSPFYPSALAGGPDAPEPVTDKQRTLPTTNAPWR